MDERTVKTFWGERAYRSSGNDYVNLLMSVLLTEDPLVAAHRHYREKKFIRNLGIRATDRVLDLGCGFGRLTFVFARLASQVEGVDFAREYIELGNKLKEERQVANVTFICSPVEEFAPNPERYDLIFLGGLLLYIQDDEKVFRLLSRLRGYLRAGGRLIVREPAPVGGRRISRQVNTFRTIGEVAEIFGKADFRLAGRSEVVPVGPIFYKLAAAVMPGRYGRKHMDLARAEAVFRAQDSFTWILKPLLRLKEKIAGSKSDIRIYFHIYESAGSSGSRGPEIAP